ncbi:unnamed protein product [Microthlaspi erraticum]|uniref:EF-1-gamma C-terminal domain-containing protein n=1 Tax=Microthlaspi erraticum TaxID=1685480 RepID=A0A6D2JYT6_9BRAS|nr:unnamed protein product [Microthlaspi erraticum]
MHTDKGNKSASEAPKNPLDLLPPSPMVLDDWKRLYSNTTKSNLREVAVKGLWDMYDPEARDTHCGSVTTSTIKRT